VLAARGRVSQALAERARIVLTCAEDGLADAPRPGAPRKITDEQVEVLVAGPRTAGRRSRVRHAGTRRPPEPAQPYPADSAH
jgi:hypothetical protein